VVDFGGNLPKCRSQPDKLKGEVDQALVNYDLEFNDH
jgi:hypothetical protein